MEIQEEKIIKWLKLTFLFLFMLLVVLFLGESFAMTLLLFYIAFMKE